MTTTLEDIHRDPAILDRAISRRERLDILAAGEVAATLCRAAAFPSTRHAGSWPSDSPRRIGSSAWATDDSR
ncbi:MAG: hypothetical protein WDN28_27545 [Chthoniobacter sp.]